MPGLKSCFYFFVNPQYRLLLKHVLIPIGEAVDLPRHLSRIFMQINDETGGLSYQLVTVRVIPVSRNVYYCTAFFKNFIDLIFFERFPLGFCDPAAIGS